MLIYCGNVVAAAAISLQWMVHVSVEAMSEAADVWCRELARERYTKNEGFTKTWEIRRIYALVMALWFLLLKSLSATHLGWSEFL